MTAIPVPLHSLRPATVATNPTMAESKTWNLKDLAVPGTVVISILGGALLLQARLLDVEHAIADMRSALERTETTAGERLRAFAVNLKTMNPTLNVPEVR